MHINVGVGEDLSIAELARTVARIISYRGGFVFDRSRPDGTRRKLLEAPARARSAGGAVSISRPALRVRTNGIAQV
jgi:GDP-L-fucose synthase